MNFNKLVNNLLVEMAVESIDVVYFSTLLDVNTKDTIKPSTAPPPKPKELVHPKEWFDDEEFLERKRQHTRARGEYMMHINRSVITSANYTKNIVKRFCANLPFKFKIYINDLFYAGTDTTLEEYINDLKLNKIKKPVVKVWTGR